MAVSLHGLSRYDQLGLRHAPLGSYRFQYGPMGRQHQKQTNAGSMQAKTPWLLGSGSLNSSDSTSRAQHVITHALPALGLLESHIVTAAMQASFKLLFLCAVIAWMSDKGMIPVNTSQVMSQVAFSVTIPTMLLVSTTKTLTNPSCSTANLIAIPFIAVTQIAIGAAMGRLAAAAVEGRLAVTRFLLGWGDLNPTPTAAAIAASTAAALRAPMAAPALLPKGKGYPDGLPQLVQLACSFGNTVTLPLMYLTTMLPGGDAARAIGFMSLFHAAWSPCLWVFGYSSIKAADKRGLHRRRFRRGPVTKLKAFWARVVAAARGSSGGSSTVQPTTNSSSSGSFLASTSQATVLVAKQVPSTGAGAGGSGQSSRAVYAVSSEDEQLPDESPAETLVKRAWAVVKVLMSAEVFKQIRQTVNPPVGAVLAGLILGLSPAGAILSNSTAAASFISTHATSPFIAWELTLALGIVRCCWETAELLASGTLALQALVLAASLFGKQGGSPLSSMSSVSSVDGGPIPPTTADVTKSAEEDDSESDIGVEDSYTGGGYTTAAATGAAVAGAKGTVEVETPSGFKVEMEGLSGSNDQSIAAYSEPFSSSSSGVSSLGVFRRLDGRESSSSSSTCSLFSSMDSQQVRGVFGTSTSNQSSSGQHGINVVHNSAQTADDASASVLSQLKPSAAWEWRAMLAVAVVRFVLLPSVTTAIVLTALHFGMLPADPVCAFMLLLQSVMPPAQNLVLMMQLQPSTAVLAPATARLLLQMYVLAVLPVTLWVSLFAKLVL